MPRLQLSDDTLTMTMKMAEGHPGAISALCEISETAEAIGPGLWASRFGIYLNLDMYGIYGCKIWMLYKDVCSQNPARVLLALRAVQLGIIPIGEVYAAIDGARALDFADLAAKVSELLPRFDVRAVTETAERRTE